MKIIGIRILIFGIFINTYVYYYLSIAILRNSREAIFNKSFYRAYIKLFKLNAYITAINPLKQNKLEIT